MPAYRRHHTTTFTANSSGCERNAPADATCEWQSACSGKRTSVGWALARNALKIPQSPLSLIESRPSCSPDQDISTELHKQSVSLDDAQPCKLIFPPTPQTLVRSDESEAEHSPSTPTSTPASSSLFKASYSRGITTNYIMTPSPSPHANIESHESNLCFTSLQPPLPSSAETFPSAESFHSARQSPSSFHSEGVITQSGDPRNELEVSEDNQDTLFDGPSPFTLEARQLGRPRCDRLDSDFGNLVSYISKEDLNDAAASADKTNDTSYEQTCQGSAMHHSLPAERNITPSESYFPDLMLRMHKLRRMPKIQSLRSLSGGFRAVSDGDNATTPQPRLIRRKPLPDRRLVSEPIKLHHTPSIEQESWGLHIPKTRERAAFEALSCKVTPLRSHSAAAVEKPKPRPRSLRHSQGNIEEILFRSSSAPFQGMRSNVEMAFVLPNNVVD
ncbi:hypothetical protein K470DRAFT_267002 [Piedraia hortae CBS 480.64]|uniref:Uncharacterized protein n=1 Tax=Piedraia hortae CBS 480.64 TaxID=1314780 RepID=A0A6A7BR45_9PEZI|nr:hypothetical protein K470DRAFT_267002 [Piedraia hortae CBS 480.64]